MGRLSLAGLRKAEYLSLCILRPGGVKGVVYDVGLGDTIVIGRAGG
jgi:hypothetical protein